jgi:hypothetical protein
MAFFAVYTLQVLAEAASRGYAILIASAHGYLSSARSSII